MTYERVDDTELMMEISLQRSEPEACRAPALAKKVAMDINNYPQRHHALDMENENDGSGRVVKRATTSIKSRHGVK